MKKDEIIKKRFSFSKALERIIFFRWLIAFLVFIILVISKIHFSSIGFYNEIFPTVCNEKEAESYRIYGEHRAIRSDEWMVHTPKYFSQKYNNFNRYSKQGSISEINSTLDYYSPTIGPELIGKPFNLGYIFFGNEYGLSFYFCMLEILLFMTAFEVFLILTKRSILVSFIGMLFVGFAPAMQWWLVPHITIVFVYAMALFCLGYYFLTTNKLYKKLILAIFLVSGIIGFSLSIFPSCQLICALIDIVLFVAVLKRDREKISINKSSIVIISFIFISSFSVLLEFIINSKEDLLAILKTDYPGTRLFVGGNKRLEAVFPSLTSLFIPYKDVNFDNNCEVATFIHFGVFFMLIYNKMRDRLKKDADGEIYVLNSFICMLIVEIVFMSMGVSELLSKLTFFRYVNRMYLCYGFTATLYTIYCFYIMWKKKDILKKHQIIILTISYIFLHVLQAENIMRQYFPLRWLFVEVSFFALVLWFVLFEFKKLAAISTVFVMGACGFNVNPICKGVSPIYNHPISVFIKNMVEKNKDDLWISLGGDSVSIGSFLLANGAKTISTTHFYPDNNEWNILGIDKKYYSAFNRYAHHKFFIGENQTKIHLEQPDSIKITVNFDVLKNRLGVKYIVARKEYLEQNRKYFPYKLKKVFEQDGIFVFSIRS